MSEEENIYKINFHVRDGFKYAKIPEDTAPGSIDTDTAYWEKVVDGLQTDKDAWAALSEKYVIPPAGEGHKYILHAWLPLDIVNPTSAAEIYNITIQRVATDKLKSFV